MKLLLKLATVCALGAQALHAQQSSSTFRTAIDRYRRSHEAEILREFRELLAIPNLASDSINIRRNATAVSAMLQRRGVRELLIGGALNRAGRTPPGPQSPRRAA